MADTIANATWRCHRSGERVARGGGPVRAPGARRSRRASSTCRSSSTTSCRRAPRPAEQHDRRRPPSAATSSIATAASSRCSVDADSIYAVPSEIDDPATPPRLCAGARRLHGPGADTLTERLRAQNRAFAYVRRQVSPRGRSRVGRLKLDGIGFMKDEPPRSTRTRSSPRTCSATSARQQGRGRHRATYDTQISGDAGQDPGPDRRARQRVHSRFERPPTRAPRWS